MERGNGPPLLSNFIQLLSFLPAGVLAFLSWNAFDYYNLGVDMMRYEHTNIYGSLLIG